jgi:hypothetical protein
VGSDDEAMKESAEKRVCPDFTWRIRYQLGRLASSNDDDLHLAASDFSEWLSSSIGRYREARDGESNPSALQGD